MYRFRQRMISFLVLPYQQRGGRIGSNALHGHELRRDFAHQPIQLLIELGDLFGEVLVATCHRA
jgi:hypothetical protein